VDQAREVFSKAVTRLRQLCVLSFGLFENGDVRVGVFPESEEILVGSAALGGVALHRVGASQLEMSQSADRFIQHNATMVEDFLELCRRFGAPMCG
jgi:hypothetical protein